MYNDNDKCKHGKELISRGAGQKRSIGMGGCSQTYAWYSTLPQIQTAAV
jgi:hypothetical protein